MLFPTMNIWPACGEVLPKGRLMSTVFPEQREKTTGKQFVASSHALSISH